MIAHLVKFWEELCAWTRQQERARRCPPRPKLFTSRWGNARFLRLPDGRVMRISKSDLKRARRIAKRETNAAFKAGASFSKR